VTQKAMVCADAEAILVIPGSSFDRVCAECSRPLMVAPTGQAMLRRSPAMKTICIPCYLALGDGTLERPTPGQLAEAGRAVVNMRRQRN
jgi:hypothetical protein